MCYPVCLWQCSVRAESVDAPWGAVGLGPCLVLRCYIFLPVVGAECHTGLLLWLGRHPKLYPTWWWPQHHWPKHVEAWNNLIVKQKFCASSWLITEINTLRCTVSKTSKRCHPVCLGQCCVRAESVHAPWGEVVLGRCWSCGVVFCCLWWGLSVTPVCCCVCVDILSCLRFSWQL